MQETDFEKWWNEKFSRRENAVPIRIGDSIRNYAFMAWDHQQERIKDLQRKNRVLNEELKELKYRIGSLEK